eukprot:CAMPEP_0174905472 /NCGR_PEP_ID=MMETSP0167-20121228/53117_1 /TAXON_ID=38298 /ORGANISM="Rhodella maculata, Strain CCMP736" /LENGTH=95 /DNA_ID=CAMNT_0016148413 /DNA_START=108 /DNA_END=395 /DNA_ORIENTATION=-
MVSSCLSGPVTTKLLMNFLAEAASTNFHCHARLSDSPSTKLTISYGGGSSWPGQVCIGPSASLCAAPPVRGGFTHGNEQAAEVDLVEEGVFVQTL